MGVELSIDVAQTPGEYVVCLRGEVDMASAPRLADVLAQLDGIVIVDCEGVRFLDSSGIAALVHARNRLLADRGELKVRNPHDNVRTVLRVVGLTGWIE